MTQQRHRYDLDTCDQEPIHRPGDIQPIGALLALDPESLVIVAASSNASEHVGRTDGASLVGETLEAAAGHAITALCREHLAGMATNHVRSHDWSPGGVGANAGVVHIHHNGSVLLLEIEPQEPGLEAEYGRWLAENRDFASSLFDYRDAMSLLRGAASEVRRVTGFDRAMVYEFDADMNGEIIVEQTNGKAQRYIGQHFPASDIPKQARRLYQMVRIRAIADTRYQPVALLESAACPVDQLDLSRCRLRSVSPIHLEYLHNIGVGATLVMTLLDGKGELWGMLVCHHDSAKTLPYPAWLFCESAADMVSMRLQHLLQEQQDQHQYRLLLRINSLYSNLFDTDNLVNAIEDSAEAILELLDASALLFSLHGERKTWGQPLEQDSWIDALIAYLADHELTQDVFCTSALSTIVENHSCSWVAGVLFVPLSNEPNDYILFLRAEQLETINWAGNPNKALSINPDTGRLNPRKSFETWREEVRGKSKSWQPAEIAGGDRIAQLIGLHLSYQLRRSRDEEARLDELAHYDQLTGIPNRALSFDRLQHALTLAEREGKGVAVLFLDLDGFKAINDELGHEAGDAALKAVAKRFSTKLRESDTIGRIGGDEFLVVAENVDADDCRQSSIEVARKLVNCLETPVDAAGHSRQLGVSIGISYYPRDGSVPKELIKLADAAMYRIKTQGGGIGFASEDDLDG